NESANRASSTFVDMLKHWALYPADTLKNLMPWGIFLLHLRKRHLQDQRLRLIAILFIANYLLYWIAPGARGRYVYPLFPLIAVLIASVLVIDKEKFQNWIDKTVTKIAGRIILVLGAIMVVVGIPPLTQPTTGFIVLVAFLAISKQFISKWKQTRIWFPFFILVTAKIVIPVLPSAHLNIEVEKGKELAAKYKNQPLFYNTNVEKHYTFAYELTRQVGRVIPQDQEFKDTSAHYLLLHKYMPKGHFELIDTFDLASDKFAIIKPNASKKQVQ
ncbi:MAG: hypothetical protein KDC92_16300, partial [Bacteroidetes bacterium]|nr:hypothetical protein [Bacteroidota bacterium]